MMKCSSGRRFGLRTAALCVLAVLSSHVSAEDTGRKTPERYPLKQTEYDPLISKLDGVLKKVTIPEILDRAGNKTVPSESLSSTKWYIDSFNITDDRRWEAQGISSSSDAGDMNQLKGEENVLAISWQDTRTSGQKLGVRVTFIRNGASYKPSDPRVYAHALLVAPDEEKDGTPSFKALEGITTGGLVWRGNWLYVTDAKEGLRVFDLRHIYEVNEMNVVGAFGKEYFGGGYKYVIPQARKYQPKIAQGATLVMHAASLDRNSTVPSIIVGELARGTSSGVQNATFARYPLDPKTNLLETNSTGFAIPYWAYVNNVRYVQGIVFAKGGLFITRSESTIDAASVGDRGGVLFWIPRSLADEYENMLPKDSQGVAFQPEQDALWVVGGNGGETFVMGLNADREDVVPDSILRKLKNKDGKDDPSIPGGSNDATPPGSADDDESPPTKLNKAQSAGIAIGVVIAAALAICVFLLFRRSKRKNEDDSDSAPLHNLENKAYSNHSYESSTAYYVKPELDGQAVYRELYPSPKRSDTESSSPASSNSSGIDRVPQSSYRIPRVPVPGRSNTQNTFELPSPQHSGSLPGHTMVASELPSPGARELTRYELEGSR